MDLCDQTMVSDTGVAVVAADAAVEIGVAVDERVLGGRSVSWRMEGRLPGCSLRMVGMQMRKSWVRWVCACCGGQEVFPEWCSPVGCA